MTTIVLRDHERAVVRLNGRVVTVLGGGRHRLPLQRPGRRREVDRVDVRLRWLLLPGQEVPAADVPGVRAGVAVQWRIADPVTFLDTDCRAEESLRMAAQVAVRDVFAAHDVESLVAARPELTATLLAAVAPAGVALGIHVERVVIRDVAAPVEVRRAQLALHTARQDGLAALERARGETAALRALANGARVLADHPALLQVRTAEAAGRTGGTVVLHCFPPTDPHNGVPVTTGTSPVTP
jgi:regulator of protease activity HflC (stomatin/prohibitin superfamily)